MKKNPQGKWWRRLDNTGKIFPLIANENLSNVFRITATLKEDVRPELLQRALEDVLPHFEGFQVKLKRGFFWYYFESNKRTPLIEQESGYPCRYIDPKSNQRSGCPTTSIGFILRCSTRSPTAWGRCSSSGRWSPGICN